MHPIIRTRLLSIASGALAGLCLLLGVAVFCTAAGAAGSNYTGSASALDTPLDHNLVAKADSLRRVIEKRTYSDADKKEIRACGREKTDFLKQARSADPEYAKVDQALNQAKLSGGNPNDPAIMSLMEKKFSYEKAFDERYIATPKGKKCTEGEARRSKAVAAALEKDKQYQELLKRIAASSSDHL